MRETSLVVQWVGLHASTTRDVGSIPGQGTEIPHGTRCRKKNYKKNLKEIIKQNTGFNDEQIAALKNNEIKYLQ